MRYIIGFLLSIGLIILVLVMIFRGGGNEPSSPNVQRKLVDYANTETVVRLTDDYPVSSNQTHRQLVTTVGRDQVVFQIRAGYEGDVLRAQTYPNNPTAYANFLRALQLAGYTQGNTDPELRDERGVCPLGRRYVYEIRSGGDRALQRLWNTSCGKVGTFQGNGETIRRLFVRQVPDYNKLTSGAQLTNF